MKWRTEHTVVVVLLVGLALPVAIYRMALSAERDMVASIGWANHRQIVLQYLSEVQMQMDAAQDAEVGYLLHGQGAADSYKDPVDRARADVAQLAAMTGANQQQQGLVKKLQTALDAKAADLAATADLAAAGKMPAALQSITSPEALTHSQDVRQWVAAARSTEMELLDSTRSGAYALQRHWARLFIYGCGAALGLLLLAFAALVWEVRKRRQAERTLAESHQQMLQQLEEQVRQQEERRGFERKSAFLAAAGHEMRTPVAAVLGYADLLLKNSEEPGFDVAAAARHIRDSSEHVAALVSDVLDLSLIEAGQMQIRPERVGVREAVEEVFDMLEAEAGAHRISLSNQVEAPVAVRADRVRLRQVLLNLVGNAVKFTPPGGRVAVECDDGEQVSIYVSDNGKGIRPENRATVFEAFRPHTPVSPTVHSGTGLGLAISKHLVELQSGTIAVESEPDVGTTFRVQLPRVDAAAATAN